MSIKTIGELYNVNGKQLQVQYKDHISDYRHWEQLSHAHDYVLFKHNLGEHLSMDKTCPSQGELYTIITNKSAHGGKGGLIAMIKGTKSEEVVWVLKKMPHSLRLKVKEITIDLSPTMKIIARRAFPNATIVSDLFHVQKLMNEAISDLRVDYRWQAIVMENAEMELAREVGRKFTPHVFSNGDTRRQLLARSRHIVMKHHSKWTDSQRRRAEILFEQYPAIAEVYEVSIALTQIYNERITDKRIALTKLARWYDSVERLGCKFFNSVIATMQNNYATIVNYFDNRSTNASAESFNAKVKAFRAQFRGARDIQFFIFRLTKLIYPPTRITAWAFFTLFHTFIDTTENAVRIRISVAIITYCLVAIVQHDMQLDRSTYEVLQILSISLTDKTHLRDLFDKTNFNDVKEQLDPLFRGYLFNF